jgi:hypothetical protein
MSPTTHPASEVEAGPTFDERRSRWPLFGVAAAVLGGIATVVPSKVNMQPDGRHTTAAVIDTLHRWPYHVGVVAGFAAVACLLVAVNGWRRWATEHAPNNLAAGTVATALTATAGAMMIGFGFLGALAVYLHGGVNATMFSREGLFSIYMVVDFGPYIAWWGATVAAAAVAWLAFRDHLVPRWIGVVSVVSVAVPVVALVATGLPGMSGVIGPIWLALVSAAFTSRRLSN